MEVTVTVKVPGTTRLLSKTSEWDSVTAYDEKDPSGENPWGPFFPGKRCKGTGYRPGTTRFLSKSKAI